MNAQDKANNIVVDFDAESQRDLPSNAGTAPLRITPFHCNGIDEVLLRSLRARATPAPGRKQHAVLSFPRHTMEMRRVEGFRTMAERRIRAGRMKRVHKPTMI